MLKLFIGFTLIGTMIDVQAERAAAHRDTMAAAASASAWRVRGLIDQHTEADCSYCAWSQLRIAATVHGPNCGSHGAAILSGNPSRRG
jgi:Zn finger protein HypA/HybF involved in hydrogenase expression